ncbi:MAG: pepF/M3 family oligoendopeptidase (pepF, pepB) [Cenarchaeum symbiont of Oopsacas minuta]|nr:pepF/M3 family oligoendopeptidase (pepF, pepB) [Cenarchaeum symbiont of Oopsacas minuta]
MSIKNTIRPKKYVQSSWDLSEIIKTPNKNVTKIIHRAEKFAKQYRNTKASISIDQFNKAMCDVNNIYEDTKSISSYAMLQHSEDTQSNNANALLSNAEKISAGIENKTLFFELWWQKEIDEKNAQRLALKSKHFEYYLTFLRRMAKYSLTESEEKVINILDTTGQSAMVRLYDRITNKFSYTVGNKKNMTREELTTLIRSPKATIRKAAYRQILGKYDENIGVLGDIYQNIVMRWENIGINMRGFATPISIRNMTNDIDDKTVSVLLDICCKNRGIFYDYFKLKAKYTGNKKLQRYDLYAPMAIQKNERKYEYNTAVHMVLCALYSFNPKISKWAKSVFDANHVDSQVRMGKRDGAFCATVRPNILPYVLLSYTNRLSDVFTLAHEIGHAIHSIAASEKPALVQEASLPLAETASTFSEMLLYESITKKISDTERASLLAEKIADWYATIMRQSYFTIFENNAHKVISNGGNSDKLSKIYQTNLKEQFGNAVSVSDDFSAEWICIPHFYHAPFYCYAYSFGNLLALALYQRYKKEDSSFDQQYIQILAGGGSKNPKTLLQEHGVDINSKKFWQGGFDYIDEQISELKRLLNVI